MHSVEDSINALEYYGKPRFNKDLRDYDVIITTYDTLRIDFEEFNKQRGIDSKNDDEENGGKKRKKKTTKKQNEEN